MTRCPDIICPCPCHRQMNPQAQLAAGVTPEFVRVSVGLENIDDIIADIDQALAKT